MKDLELSRLEKEEIIAKRQKKERHLKVVADNEVTQSNAGIAGNTYLIFNICNVMR